MKIKLTALAFLLTTSVFVTLNAQKATNLDAASFASGIKKMTNEQIIDVRTPGEYKQGHLENALNIDISSSDFQQKIAKLDKSKPVFVYCLSGARSSAAMDYLSSEGFKEVYNLTGGMMRWRAAGMPETSSTTVTKPASNGMTVAQFRALLNTNKLVLIDYYAEWCSPCQKMKPHVLEIAQEMKDKVLVVMIDADKNKNLLKELNIDNVPVLALYKNKKMVWTNSGYLSKAEILKKIKTY